MYNNGQHHYGTESIQNLTMLASHSTVARRTKARSLVIVGPCANAIYTFGITCYVLIGTKYIVIVILYLSMYIESILIIRL